MENFKISFTSPWLLFVIIPALALVLYTFLRVNKRFRYTRNRIISLIMGLITITLCTFMISGMVFSYDKHNDKNEVLLLVDESYSNLENKNKKDEFIREAIESNPKSVSLGIISFGYDAVYSLELTSDMDGAYSSYKEAKKPDNSGSNLAKGLKMAGEVLKNKSTSKIVILTDGIETDGNALREINNLSIDGVMIDCVEFKNNTTKNDLMLKGVKKPEEAIRLNEQITLELEIESSIRGDSEIKVYDNDEEIHFEYSTINKGLNTILINHSFKTPGLHELRFEAKLNNDEVKENNILYSFINIEVVDKILILDRDNEALSLEPILSEKYQVKALNINDAPMDIDSLREFNQVILMNIANSDMPEGFIDILNSYVYDFGGGLLTVGGYKDSNGKLANTYNRADMEGTLYQEMLPVIAEDYTPPVAVMIVLDTSGSMGNPFVGSITNKTVMDEAIESAKSTLRALDTRDYLGMVTFGATASMIIEPTPVAKKGEIETAIGRVTEKMSATVYSAGLEKAGLALRSLTGVNKKHIIFITDGDASAGDTEYLNKTRENYESGITTSVITLGTKHIESVLEIPEVGHGRMYNATSGDALTEAIKKDVSAPEIREFQLKTFKPEIKDGGSIFNGILDSDIPTLDGFFGAKLKRGSKAHLVGEYGEPIYASHSYGKGKVGSFMCDLNGIYSSSFINSEVGKRLINNIAGSLFPITSISKEEIELSVESLNYTLRVNAYSDIKRDEKIRLIVSKVDPTGERVEVYKEELTDFKNSKAIDIELKDSGIYLIECERLDKEGRVTAHKEAYSSLSYSMEYNQFLNKDDHLSHLKEMAKEGGGKIISKGSESYNNLVMSYHKEYDPRIVFASIVVVALLIDLAVTKFKFKWPHEIIKERKERKNEK